MRPMLWQRQREPIFLRWARSRAPQKVGVWVDSGSRDRETMDRSSAVMSSFIAE